MGSFNFLGLVSLLTAASAAVSAGGSNGTPRRAESTCSDVHIFLARGNNEPYPGRQSNLVMAVCDGLSSCDYEDLVYSAQYTDEFCKTAYWGVIAGFTQMAAYANRCPNSKLILGGYSQGAQIVTDILGGGGGTLYNGCVQPSTPAMSRSTAPGSMIAAAIVFGDVRHTANQPYNYDTGSVYNSEFPRTSAMLSALDDYASVLRNWCDADDIICAFGVTDSTNFTAHWGYYDHYAAAAGSFVKSVASLTDNSDFTTTIATSVSGAVQDYATVGTATPSGDVTIETLWTLSTAVTAVPHSGSTAHSASSSSSGSSSASTAPKTTSSSIVSVTSSSQSSSTSSVSSTSSFSSSSTVTSTSSHMTSSSTNSTAVTSSTATTSSSGTTTAVVSSTTAGSYAARNGGFSASFGGLVIAVIGAMLVQ